MVDTQAGTAKMSKKSAVEVYKHKEKHKFFAPLGGHKIKLERYR